ncbi:allograft inflammatory factor 1-like isoform X2 [Mizuhopecten yessoensis]|uniref:allograft inflammatory factor 1-like isoform X2 n=1 Tax=Mizuhopecten yessoensis TaxID=6573 RepID=UPI000B45A541|nr:allograft inflammatory factor 1-like isoform X2 [Mizuhopecten yessoensis]
MNSFQGGKLFGQLKSKQDEELTSINQTYLDDDALQEIEELPEQLNKYKDQFMEFDLDNSGDIDIMELKQMMEKLNCAKTHLELKKMIAEVDTTGSGTISYKEFLDMMLGTKSTVLKLILKFEEKMREKERPKGLPPKRDLSSLP